MNVRRLALWTLPVGLVTFGCSDPPRTDDNSTSDTEGPTTVDPTTASTSGTTDDSTTSTTNDSLDDSGSSSSSTGDGECETFLCGGDCCSSDEECVLGECVDACATGVRCGDDLAVCCGEGEVCLQPECVPAGDPCLDSYDCPEGEFCETEIFPREEGGACLPQPDPLTCEILPDFDDVEVALEWSWTEEQVIANPVVADIDGDDVPEVIISTTYWDENGDGNEASSGEGHITGVIVVFDGATGEEQFRVLNTPQGCAPDDNCQHFGSYGRATIGVADVDGNDLPDIIYAGRPVSNPLNRSIIHAVNGGGQRLWSSHTPEGADHFIYVRNGAPSFANLDDDPESEIIFGGAIIDNDGTVVHDQDGDGGLFGSPTGYRGPISALADVNGDNYPEIITGRHAWSVDWTVNGVGQPEVTLNQLWDAGGDDGFPAIADLDQNGTPEVVLVTGGQVRVVDGLTGELWCGVDPTGAQCNANDAARTQPLFFPDLGVEEDRGGPPTIADFDGDGRPEFAAAGAGGYVVFDLNREDEEVSTPNGFPPPPPGDIFVRWFSETQDETSRSTGSSVFDFQGDGVAEVLYSDECYTRVYNGLTGEIILEIENSSATIHEYPIVADSDGDGNSEILVVANDVGADVRCGENFPGYTPRRGLFVYGDPNDSWVRTRRVWNSHTYHVTNSDSLGLTPAVEDDNWTVPGLNNYRQNFQGAGVFNAPDLSVDLAVSFNNCLDEEFTLVATIRNEGAIGIPAEVPVTLYEGTDNTGDEVGTELTAVPLLPGAFTIVEWQVPAPGGEPKNFYVEVDGGDGVVTECEEGNNDATTETVSCPVPG